jgi:hypothetical protein
MTPISAETSTVGEVIAGAGGQATFAGDDVPPDGLPPDEPLPEEPFPDEAPLPDPLPAGEPFPDAPPLAPGADDSPDFESPDGFAAGSEPFGFWVAPTGSFAAARLSVR